MKLDNVTICAIDCVHPQLAVDAIKRSQKHIEFADSILFTDTSLKNNNLRTVEIAAVKHMDDYDTFVFKELHKHIKTDHVLIVQWDGWVVDPDAWDERFLNYDYIGAPWSFYDDGYVVGNGGFSLRTKRLLETLTNDEFAVVHNQAEDHAICREYRNILEKNYDIKFAPLKLAEQFSFESYMTDNITFGFHGVYNLWHQATDEEIVDMFKAISQSTVKDKLKQRSYFAVLVSYFNMKKFSVVKKLYAIMKEHFDVNFIGDGIYSASNSVDFTAHFIKVCETL